MYGKQNAFTLVETLIVVVIMFIIFGIVIFGTAGVRSSARDNRRKADIAEIASAIQRYYSDCGAYPTASAFSSVPVGGALRGNGTSSPTCLTTNTYISEKPADPQTGTRNYSYAPTANGFIVCASLEDGPSTGVSGCGSCGGVCNFAISKP